MTTTPALDERAIEALLSGVPLPGHDDLVGALSALAALPAAPAPSALLAEVLREGLPATSGPAAVDLREPVRPRRRWTAGVGLAVAAATAGLLTAATANALPAPAQRVVSDVVGVVTPFDLPSPPADPGPAPLSEQPDEVADDDAAARPTDVSDEPADDAVGPAGAPGGASDRDSDDKAEVVRRDDTGSRDAAPDDSGSRDSGSRDEDVPAAPQEPAGLPEQAERGADPATDTPSAPSSLDEAPSVDGSQVEEAAGPVSESDD